MLRYLILFLLSCALVHAAPHKSKHKKSDGPYMVLDQKQTGDYNIQLHLKNFQIIAMLGDDALGDYDYNYDYADFTIKPSSPTSITTTMKPTSSNPLTTQKEPPTKLPVNVGSEPIVTVLDLLFPEAQNPVQPEKPSSVIVNNTHQHPPEVIVPQPMKDPKKEEENQKPDTENQPNIAIEKEKDNPNLSSETGQNEISTSKSPSSSQTPFSSTSNPSSTSPSLPEPASPFPESSNGKIKVQIMEVPSIGIVPGEEVQGDANPNVLQGELASYRKCSSGYARDKKGRCRRIRRPGVSSQLPFGLSRFASNLASRLRLPTHENPSKSLLETD